MLNLFDTMSKVALEWGFYINWATIRNKLDTLLA